MAIRSARKESAKPSQLASAMDALTARASPPALTPNRGWFGKTFVEPVEIFIARAVYAFKTIAIAVGVLVVSLVGLMIYIGWNLPDSTQTAYQPAVSAPLITTTSSAPAVAPSAPTRNDVPPKPHRAATASKAHKETIREKIYETWSGKEVVHKKDGTTYERRQPK